MESMQNFNRKFTEMITRNADDLSKVFVLGNPYDS